MANIASAKKRARQAEGRRQRNMGARSTMRTYVKKVREAVDAGEKDAAQAAYVKATSMVDKAVGKGLIHKNKAARIKGRLNKAVAALAA
ncbi:MAG: 30S ribosomal protein S20 [Gammaproteobacteria bacterium]|nr:30S ribosomal protein S20 [Gammaproteobacteria bacterium]